MANNTRNYGLTLASKTKGVTVLSSEEKEIGTPLQENLKDKALIGVRMTLKGFRMLVPCILSTVIGVNLNDYHVTLFQLTMIVINLRTKFIASTTDSK